jgi:hypothetical protein
MVLLRNEDKALPFVPAAINAVEADHVQRGRGPRDFMTAATDSAATDAAAAPAPKVAVVGPFALHARWVYNRYSHVPTTGLLVSVADAMTQASRAGTLSNVSTALQDAQIIRKRLHAMTTQARRWWPPWTAQRSLWYAWVLVSPSSQKGRPALALTFQVSKHSW